MKKTKSLALQERAVKLIPGMTQLLSKRPDMYSRGVWPTYFKEAKGIKITDLDGNEYLDFSIGGIGATVLGYADEDVNKAVKLVIDMGSASTLNPPEEVELAQLLIDLHPWAQMARFARSGGEAMAMAIRIVRTAMKKDIIIFCGYHGWMDWYLAANLGREGALDDQWIVGLPPNGVPKGLTGTVLPFIFNNIESFSRAVNEAGENLAGIVMEPLRNYYPNQSFMKKIHQTVKEKKIPLIIDEISAGFRITNGGAHLKLGWKPDIAVFSKALGNGYPVSAVIGKKWIMKHAQESFITSTNWTERVGNAAALAMIKKFIKKNVASHLVEIADMVWNIWEEKALKHGIALEIGGFKPMIHFRFKENHQVCIAYFTQEMLKKGFLASAGFYSMYAHSKKDVKKYEIAVDEVFSKISELIRINSVESHLEGKPASTGFARIN